MINLLLVDDNDCDRELISILISSFKEVCVHPASFPPEPNEAGFYDGVIIDEHLGPSVSGFSFAKQVLDAAPLVPIMLLSGDPNYATLDYKIFVDEVSCKNDYAQMHLAMSAFVRNCNRVKMAAKSSKTGRGRRSSDVRAITS